MMTGAKGPRATTVRKVAAVVDLLKSGTKLICALEQSQLSGTSWYYWAAKEEGIEGYRRQKRTRKAILNNRIRKAMFLLAGGMTIAQAAKRTKSNPFTLRYRLRKEASRLESEADHG
jgi:hypothetical protein